MNFTAHLRRTTVCAALSSTLLMPAVHAQTLPDAGALQQQIERERQQNLPRRTTPEKISIVSQGVV